MSAKNIEDAYPLSPMQEGLLFHGLYAPEGGLYVTQFDCELHDVDVSAIRRAWQQIIDRYPAFRTAFVWKNVEKPLQVVGRRVELPFQLEDWRGLPPGQQQERLDAYLVEDRRRGFQLNKAPLLRLALFRVSDEAHQLVLTHHHLVVDGWSMAMVFKEAFDLYEAFAEGREPRLEPSHPYRDYIAWLQRQDLSKAEEFWRETLKGFTTPTPLVIDRVSGGSRGREEAYSEYQLKLSTSTTAALQALTRQHQLTMNTVAQGAWALLLSRYSGERDVVFGSVSAGRPATLPGIETMVGLFINNLPVRARVSPETPLIAWLQDLQARQSEARQFEYSPLTQVQGWSDVPRGVPLFSSIVAFQNFPITAPKGRGSREVGTLRTFEGGNYPLALSASDGSELSLILRYDPRLFDASAILRMLGHLRTLLDGIAENVEHRRISELTLLTEPERRRILWEWNDTATDYPWRQSVQELFEEQAARTPEAIAVVFDDERLSYRELNGRANQVAHYLRGRGVRPEVAVGIYMERGVEMIVGFLGVLKAGGAYVPFDPQNPLDRIAFMIEDAKVEFLLTQERWLDNLPSRRERAMCLDTQWEDFAGQSTDNPDVTVGADNLAYVMYTSGSTGTPKGICITHRAVARLVCNSNYVQLDGADVVAQASNASFDAATFEIWGALLHGARLVGINREALLSPATLAAQLKRDGVSTLFLTTALFNQMARQHPEGFSTLKHLLFGGEMVDVECVRRVSEGSGPERLLHVYGPTETTTFAAWWSVDGVKAGANNLPFGRPLSNTELYVLDEQARPVPVGVVGELYIGGDGLARGYLRRPELTAEKFVPHPFSREAGARLYRTGDLVRCQDDGAVEFVGRVDHQVKVRGFRIELGEIEAMFNHHPAIREAVVVVREDEQRERHLVAYVVSEQEPAPTVGELRRYLGAKLPDYMIPAQYVWLAEMPLNVNGKIDRHALPAPESERPRLGEEYSAPRTPPEELLAGIWGKVFQVDRVGIHDTFFELGGESILAIKLVSLINKGFNIELPLRSLFEHPTVAGLASVVVQCQAERADEEELISLLAEVEDVSEDDARSMLID
ncbi:MAG TPA: amino acid adenylation domain-containing protein [Pyrinomonadaceae bacterium]